MFLYNVCAFSLDLILYKCLFILVSSLEIKCVLKQETICCRKTLPKFIEGFDPSSLCSEKSFFNNVRAFL